EAAGVTAGGVVDVGALGIRLQAPGGTTQADHHGGSGAQAEHPTTPVGANPLPGAPPDAGAEAGGRRPGGVLTEEGLAERLAEAGFFVDRPRTGTTPREVGLHVEALGRLEFAVEIGMKD